MGIQALGSRSGAWGEPQIHSAGYTLAKRMIMELRPIIGLCVLVLGVNGSGAAAVDATLADAVEQRDHARIKALLNTGTGPGRYHHDLTVCR